MFEPDAAGVTQVVPSPNHRLRRDGERLEFVIVHGTWMAGDDEALARLRDPEIQVSCHYYITREGRVIQLVPEALVAYHAGKSQAVNSEGVMVDGLNGWSLGIEVANCGPFVNLPPDIDSEGLFGWATFEPYTEAQYAALKALVEDIVARHPGISRERVLGHHEVSLGRKSDPGLHFDWGWWR